ncbi:MAG: hypothetical protein HOD92_15155 [Deltaproteobacteria bacterium]|jgi:hypothetical protein|nr:hypothetical protein [Deltaproteobacteria bacterium]
MIFLGSKGRKTILLITILLISLITIDLFLIQYDLHSSIFVRTIKHYYLLPKLNRTEQFYRARKLPLHTDEFVMMLWLWPKLATEVSRVYEKDPFLRIYSSILFSDTLHISRRVNLLEEAAELIRFSGENTLFYDFGNQYNAVLTEPRDDRVLKAMYCDKTGYDELDFKIMYSLRDHNGGYGDTHYLLSLLLLEKFQCVNQTIIEQTKQQVINDLIDAQSLDNSFSDLFAERMVLLFWTGRYDVIKFNWIMRVAKEQTDDGGWWDVETDGTDPHITGLSALAIKYFIEARRVDDIVTMQ